MFFLWLRIVRKGGGEFLTKKLTFDNLTNNAPDNSNRSLVKYLI